MELQSVLSAKGAKLEPNNLFPPGKSLQRNACGVSQRRSLGPKSATSALWACTSKPLAYFVTKKGGHKAHRKAQVSMEFMMVAGFVMVIVIVFITVTGNRLLDLNDEREYAIANDIAKTVKSELGTAVQLEPGYNRTFTVPQTISEKNYNVYIANSTIVLVTKRFQIELPTVNVIGSLNKGNNVITKVGNEIHLN